MNLAANDNSTVIHDVAVQHVSQIDDDIDNENRVDELEKSYK